MKSTSFSRIQLTRLWVASLFFLLSGLTLLQAQGWIRHYPSTGGILTGAAEPTAMVIADNGDFIFGGGGGFVPTQSADFLFLQRNDQQGNPVWTRRHEISTWNLNFLEKCPGGGFVGGGNSRENGFDEQMLFRVSESGDSLWAINPQPGVNGYLYGVITTFDGMLLVSGTARNSQLGNGERMTVLYKINPQDGSIIWMQWYPGHGWNEFGGALMETPVGSLVQSNIGKDTCFIRHLYSDGFLQFVVKIPMLSSSYPILAKPELDGYTFLNRESNGEAWFRRYDYNGNLLASKVTPDAVFILPPFAEQANGFGFASNYLRNDGKVLPSLWRMDLQGNFSNTLYPIDNFSVGPDYFAKCIRPTQDGGYLIVGPNAGQATWFALKLDSLGQVNSGQITGNAFKDNSADCSPNPDEISANGIIVRATDLDFGSKWYETTDSAGNYEFRIPIGNYDVKLLEPGNSPGYWLACLDQTALLTIQGDSIGLDSMGIKPVVECPFMQLDMAAGLFRPCLPVAININVLNSGTVSADSVVVLLELDPLLTYDSSSLAPAAQIGQQLWFNFDTLEALGTATFKVWATVSCDASLDQILCINGHVWPDSICNQNNLAWDGSDLRVQAFCDGDSVRFKVSNVGAGNMSEASQLVIIEDYIILRSVSLQLPSGADTIVTEANPNGQTYYAGIRQTEGYFGYPVAADGVEICDGQGTPGMLMQYPLFEGGIFEEQFCAEVRTAFDPNDKRGFPLGYGDHHYIDRGIPIDYMIRFQNTGNDTAFLVVLRDTLPTTLDASTLRMGAGSHPFTWELDGQGVLTCRFANIMLPDSNTNEPASHGYVTFSVLPRADLSAGTQVLNRAAIYFDFNAPVLTEYAMHTVDSNFITVDIQTTPATAPVVSAWPNPARDQVWLELPAGFSYPCRLNLYDTFGRLIREEKVSSNRQVLARQSLPSGVYLLELTDGTGKKGVGKVVWGG
ncbi:MAG: T9SS type A sorting domain-containing protein [Chitinophagales bacterium]|nr:T9SS type A sorting domain-containing protein [Chitinophagales bacterium]